MAKTLTAADLKSLIRLASTMEKGSQERRAILAGLRESKRASRSSKLAIGVGEGKTAADLAEGLVVPRNLVQKAEQAVEAEVAVLYAVEAAFNDWLALRKRNGGVGPLGDIREYLDANYENREWRNKVYSTFSHATWRGLDTQNFYKHVKAGLEELQGTFGEAENVLDVLKAMK